MDDDGIAWSGPKCTDCGRDLDAEPIASGGTLKVIYSCSVHGVIAIRDPFP